MEWIHISEVKNTQRLIIQARRQVLMKAVILKSESHSYSKNEIAGPSIMNTE